MGSRAEHNTANPRIAIAHDYLTQKGGAERVVLAMAEIFPDAPIYTTLYNPETTFSEFQALDVRPSFLNRIGIFRRHHRTALPLLALASQSTFIDADVVVVSSSGWAHGMRTDGQKLVYCYSPARWLYQRHRYLGDQPPTVAKAALAALTPALKSWDRRAARSADRYMAISSVVQERIRREYGISAEVLPAPVPTLGGSGLVPSKPHALDVGPSEFYLVVSRLLPYKNVGVIVDAFAHEATRQLVVVGSGPEEAALRRRASDSVHFLSGLSDAEMTWLYANCRSLVAVSHEDFGLTPLEAGMFGKPSIVLRGGGFLDTMTNETAVFLTAPTSEAITDGIRQLEERDWHAPRIAANAARFGKTAFAERLRLLVDDTAAQSRLDTSPS